MNFWLCLVGSFLIAAFGQPGWVPGIGCLAGAAGFALFWKAMLSLARTKDRFFLSLGWFALVQGVHLSWMTATTYMGFLILGVYWGLLLGLGLQFALLSSFLKPEEPLGWRKLIALSGVWVFFEYARVYFMSGFTWNPAGLALAGSEYSLQFAAVLGVYGLSFWVFLVNLTALKAWLEKSKRLAAVWVFMALVPYLYGFFHLSSSPGASKTVSAALVQTGILPEQRDYNRKLADKYIPPIEQWDRILSQLIEEGPLDLIVLPEVALPYDAYRKFYPYQMVRLLWARHFGKEALSRLPPLQEPYAETHYEMGEAKWSVNNLYLAQALADQYGANVLAGLEVQDPATRLKYNTVFHFQPNQLTPGRYDKRVLVPVGEYVPFKNLRFIARFLEEHYNIGDSFHPGTDPVVFPGPLPIGVSICIEELYPDLMRDLKNKGAKLFVNVSNDIWFPNSRLPLQHFQHARVRAVENGVCVLRSCNSGITGSIDRFGRPQAILTPSESSPGALFLTFPAEAHWTLYTWWGDAAILSLSLVSILTFLLFRKKKLP